MGCQNFHVIGFPFHYQAESHLRSSFHYPLSADMRDVAGFKLAVQASVYVVDGCSCENG